MKRFRFVVLMLLAVLLPVRGAVAASMTCPGGAQTGIAVEASGHGHDGMHDGMHAGGAVDAHHPAAGDQAHGHASDASSSSAGHAGACPSCAGGCCVTPLAFAPPSVAGPLLAAAAPYPPLGTRVAVHHSGGPDRPPRTC